MIETTGKRYVMHSLRPFIVVVLLVATPFVSSGQQAGTIAPGDTLLVDGVPAIPATLATA